jgi:hypothetical protein
MGKSSLFDAQAFLRRRPLAWRPVGGQGLNRQPPAPVAVAKPKSTAPVAVAKPKSTASLHARVRQVDRENKTEETPNSGQLELQPNVPGLSRGALVEQCSVTGPHNLGATGNFQKIDNGKNS